MRAQTFNLNAFLTSLTSLCFWSILFSNRVVEESSSLNVAARSKYGGVG